jgi:glycyl-tRNA synthetase (class II)
MFAIGVRHIVPCKAFARAQAVTIRERDSVEQVRVPIAGLVDALRERLEE